MPFRALSRNHKDDQFISDFRPAPEVLNDSRQFPIGNHTLGFQSDIHQQFFRVDADNHSVDNHSTANVADSPFTGV